MDRLSRLPTGNLNAVSPAPLLGINHKNNPFDDGGTPGLPVHRGQMKLATSQIEGRPRLISEDVHQTNPINVLGSIDRLQESQEMKKQTGSKR